MSVADYLIATSALARILLRQSTEDWTRRVSAGLVALCDLTELELLSSARSAEDREKVRERLALYTWCPCLTGCSGAPGPYKNNSPPRESTEAPAPWICYWLPQRNSRA